MTPTEVLNEISKMPLVEKRRLLNSLNREINEAEDTNLENREQLFLDRLRQQGLLSQMPHRNSDDEIRQNFKRVEIRGEFLSETIIKERG